MEKSRVKSRKVIILMLIGLVLVMSYNVQAKYKLNIGMVVSESDPMYKGSLYL